MLRQFLCTSSPKKCSPHPHRIQKNKNRRRQFFFLRAKCRRIFAGVFVRVILKGCGGPVPLSVGLRTKRCKIFTSNDMVSSEEFAELTAHNCRKECSRNKNQESFFAKPNYVFFNPFFSEHETGFRFLKKEYMDQRNWVERKPKHEI